MPKVEYTFHTSFYEYGKAKHRLSGEVTDEDKNYRGQYSFHETFAVLSRLIEELEVPLNTEVKVTIETTKPV